MKSLRSYFLAARPKTLLISLSVWMTGVGLSLSELSKIHLFLNFVILLSMILLQVTVNYFNDVLDFKNNKDTSKRLGPQRMVFEGLISSTAMMRASFLTLFLSLTAGAYLVFKGGVVILTIGLMAGIMTYLYSAPSISIAERGLSELFVFLFFGLLAVSGIFFLNIKNLEPFSIKNFFNFDFSMIPFSSIVAGSQMGFLSTSILIINHLRDEKEDRQTGKKTLVVRKGFSWGFKEWSLMTFLPFLLGSYWFFFEKNLKVFLFPFLTLPFFIFIFLNMKKENPSFKYNSYLSLASLSQFLFSILLFVGWQV